MDGLRIMRPMATVFVLMSLISACSNCSRNYAQTAFNGFLDPRKTQASVSKAGGVIDLQTPEVGLVQVRIPEGAFPKPQPVDLVTGPNSETDEEFGAHPYTRVLQKVPGEIRIVLGKEQPAQPLQVCLIRSRVFHGSAGELVPLTHEIYDGENETLSHFLAAERKNSSGDHDCLELAPGTFSNLNNIEGRFETFIVFGRRNQEK